MAATLAVFTLSALAPAHAAAAGTPVVQRVEAVSTTNALRVTVVTTASRTPECKWLTLRRPNRLVLDLPGFLWGPRADASLPGGRAGVERVRAGQFRRRPPVTRLVFDLSVPPDRVRYRISPRSGGDLEIQFSPAGRAPAPAPAPRPEPAPTARVTSEPATPSPAPPIPAPEPAEPELSSLAAEPSPVPGPAAASRPARPQTDIIGWWLTLFLTAIAGLLAVIALRARMHFRERRTQLQKALESGDATQRAEALEALAKWPASDVYSLRDILLTAAEDPSPSVAERATSLLRTICPAEALIAQLARGFSSPRAEAARLLALHPAAIAAEPLFHAALSAPPAVRQAAFDALVKLSRKEALRPVLLALIQDEQAARSLAADIVRAAGAQSAQVLRAALGDLDDLMRCAAIEALVLIAPEGSADAVSALLSDPLPEVRARAVRALGRLKVDGRFRAPMLAALRDPSDSVQQAAALSLARVGGEHLAELVTALDERASQNRDLRVADELLEAIAAQSAEPFAALARAVSSINRTFAAGLAHALEGAGWLDAWVQHLPEAEPEEREIVVPLLRGAAEAGVSGPLLRGLEIGVPELRQTCARLLGETKQEPAVQSLSDLLTVPQELVRIAAAQALGEIGGPDAVAGLVRALEDPAAAVRTTAARSIAQASPARPAEESESEENTPRAAAAGALTKALRDPAPEVRAAAASGLAALEADDAVPTLIEVALHDSDVSVRAAGVAALGRMRAYDVLPLLMDVVNDPDPGLRARAVEIFGCSADPMVADVLVSALDDPDLNVRRAAGRGIWEIASRGQLDTLLPHVKSPDPKIRSAIAGTVGKVGAAEHGAALAEAAADPDPFVRAAIVNALARLGEGAADYLDAVTARLADADAFVRARALDALAAIAPTSEEAALEAVPLASDPDPRVQDAVATCLLGYASRDVRGPLLELLSDPARRPEALQMLQQADEAQLRALLRAAQSLSADAGRSAIETVSYLLSRRWRAEDFRAELDSLDPETRRAGLEGLALVGTSEAMKEVCRVLSADPSREIRIRAVDILAESPDPAAYEALKKAARADPEQGVRDAAAAAIAAPRFPTG